MLLDHFALIYFDRFNLLHSALGRLVLPAFSFMLVYNFIYRTKSKEKYLLNLLVLAIVSQPIYLYALNRDSYGLNILFTLFFGMGFIYLYEYKDQVKDFFDSKMKQEFFNFLSFFILALTLILLSEFLSYSIFGLLTLFMFYAVMKNPNYLCLFGLITSLFLLNISSIDILSIVVTMFFIPCLVLIKRIHFEIRRLPGKYFYLFYPLHLFILRALS